MADVRMYILDDHKPRWGWLARCGNLTPDNKRLEGVSFGVGSYDHAIVGTKVLQFFIITLASNNNYVDLELRDWKFGDELRKLIATKRWQDALISTLKFSLYFGNFIFTFLKCPTIQATHIPLLDTLELAAGKVSALLTLRIGWHGYFSCVKHPVSFTF